MLNSIVTGADLLIHLHVSVSPCHRCQGLIKENGTLFSSAPSRQPSNAKWRAAAAGAACGTVYWSSQSTPPPAILPYPHYLLKFTLITLPIFINI